MKDASDEQPVAELQRFLVEAIKKYVADSPLNRLTLVDNSPIWEEPLVAFADGDDPLFDQYKAVVGEFHLTPREALAAHVRATTGAAPPAWPRVGVVSWILPAAKKTRLSNRRMTEGPSRRWNNTRFQGEDFNDSLRRHVVSLLQERGYVAVAPVITELFKIHFTPKGLASTWSERHVAYVAGHGTFGLSDGLITSRGIAHRCGSVVTDVAFIPSARDYSGPFDYCLHKSEGSCGRCVKRCPCGAIGPDGHDKEKCRQYMFVAQLEWTKKPGYIGNYSGCGLCQTGVPCEARIPRRGGATAEPAVVGLKARG